jgi:hypothetical protein
MKQAKDRHQHHQHQQHHQSQHHHQHHHGTNPSSSVTRTKNKDEQQRQNNRQYQQPNKAQPPSHKRDPTTQVVITGVPHKPGESAADIVSNIARIKDINLPTDQFRAHRIVHRGRDNKAISKIIAEFASNAIKVLFQRSSYSITAADYARGERPEWDTIYQQDAAEKIYINDNLTREQAALFYKTRQFKKQNGYRHAWTEDGTIFIRKEDDEAIEIKSEEDLKKLNPDQDEQ